MGLPRATRGSRTLAQLHPDDSDARTPRLPRAALASAACAVVSVAVACGLGATLRGRLLRSLEEPQRYGVASDLRPRLRGVGAALAVSMLAASAAVALGVTARLRSQRRGTGAAIALGGGTLVVLLVAGVGLVVFLGWVALVLALLWAAVELGVP